MNEKDKIVWRYRIRGKDWFRPWEYTEVQPRRKPSTTFEVEKLLVQTASEIADVLVATGMG